MDFPDKCMSLPEVSRQCGIPRRVLYNIANTPNQRCAFRFSQKGKIWFDTQKLARELEKRLVR